MEDSPFPIDHSPAAATTTTTTTCFLYPPFSCLSSTTDASSYWRVNVIWRALLGSMITLRVAFALAEIEVVNTPRLINTAYLQAYGGAFSTVLPTYSLTIPSCTSKVKSIITTSRCCHVIISRLGVWREIHANLLSLPHSFLHRRSKCRERTFHGLFSWGY